MDGTPALPWPAFPAFLLRARTPAPHPTHLPCAPVSLLHTCPAPASLPPCPALAHLSRGRAPAPHPTHEPWRTCPVPHTLHTVRIRTPSRTTHHAPHTCPCTPHNPAPTHLPSHIPGALAHAAHTRIRMEGQFRES
ncbi:hypothetical protein P7K49_012238 [Saguinus oedipus]|uniref:Uncharacterized protein n=1 Tax=Saguinus oedipus TaxID=9490 RepID=A0ABQ9VTM0_SAGOE|nr:hypothetical protein P7K49_012238 [Saguinus oedipus]